MRFRMTADFKQSTRGLIILCLLFTFSLSPGWAHENDFFEMSLEELINLQVVSAAKKPTSRFKTPAAIFVITREDIKHSGANSIPELLKMVPGMNVAQLDTNRWAISARGFNGEFANKLLVMIDGRSVYTPVFSGVYWDIQDLILEEIDRIEVIRGPGAALWGANAVNGIVNIITRSAEDTSGRHLTTWMGNEAAGGLSRRQSGAINPKSHLRLTAKGFARGDSQRDNTGAEDDSTQGRAGFRWDHTGATYTGKTTGGFYQGQQGTNFDRITYQGDYHDFFNDDTDLRGAHLLTSWSRKLNEHSHQTLQLYFDYSHRETALYNEELQTLDVDFQQNYAFDAGHQLTWGGNLRAHADHIETHSHTLMDPARDQYDLFGVFAQADYSLCKDLTLTLGSKFEHNDFTGWEIQPNGRLLWELSETVSLWGAVSSAVRTPSRLESDGQIVVTLLPPGHPENPSPLPAFVIFRGDDAYASEELTAYELGLRTLLNDGFRFDLALFLNNYDKLRAGQYQPQDVINVAGVPAYVDVGRLAGNTLHGETYGFEMAVEWQASEAWKLMGSYSYIDMDFDFDNRLEEYLNSFSAQHQASLQSRFALTCNIETNLWLTYTDAIKVQSQPQIWDLSIWIGWQPAPQWQWELVGQNLLHNQKKQLNSEVTSMVSSDIERSGFLRVNYQF